MTFFGIFVTAVGAVLACTKVLVASIIMVGDLKLHPADFLFKMAPFAFTLCTMFAGMMDEYGTAIHEYLPEPHSKIWRLVLVLTFNGMIAFFLNWTSFTSTKLTSPVTMAVTGNVKQAITIMISMYIFGQKRTWLNMAGSLLTIFGGCLYTFCSIVFSDSDKQELPISNNSSLLDEPEFTSPGTSKFGSSTLDMEESLSNAK